MLMTAFRDRQQQQTTADETKQSSRRSLDGASSAVETQIKLGLARAEQLINQDTLT